MTWILPTRRKVMPRLKRMAKLRSADRHRPGYWRDYHQRNFSTRRPYLTGKRREYLALRRSA